MPTAIAIPPTIAILEPFLIMFVPDILAPIIPKMKSAAIDRITEILMAAPAGQRIYGKSGTNPEMKYEKNITNPEMKLLLEGVSAPILSPSAEYSERKLPAAIENASTNIKISPVKNMVPLGTLAIATPERSPTVETRLSSTPNIKFLK